MIESTLVIDDICEHDVDIIHITCIDRNITINQVVYKFNDASIDDKRILKVLYLCYLCINPMTLRYNCNLLRSCTNAIRIVRTKYELPQVSEIFKQSLDNLISIKSGGIFAEVIFTLAIITDNNIKRLVLYPTDINEIDNIRNYSITDRSLQIKSEMLLSYSDVW